MTIQYLVRKIETCRTCKGEKILFNPHWKRIKRENIEWSNKNNVPILSLKSADDWSRRIKEQWPDGYPPPEVEPCHECEGEGKTETWIDLEDALREVAGDAPSGPAHRVWCSCGKSTVAVWNTETARYDAHYVLDDTED
jgi:hypothetical protein